MKKTYSIGEVSAMLRLGIDAIRFYEKKGLVHPQKDKHNKYRVYTMTNILELLDIIYYRELDMSISDITEIIQSGSKETMKILLNEKKNNALNRIRFEKQLVKKIELIETAYNTIENHHGISIKKFPKTWILAHGNEKDEIMRSQISDFTKEQFVMSCIYSTYHITNNTREDFCITMEQSVMKEFNISWKNCEKLDLGLCIYKVIQLRKEEVPIQEVDEMCLYAKEHGYSYENIIYIHEIPLTAYTDESNYFTEIYLPIKKI